MAKISFGESSRRSDPEEFPCPRPSSSQKGSVAVLGYGVQGPGRPQHEGQRNSGDHRPAEEHSFLDKALKDGWVPGETLFPWKRHAREERSSNICSPTRAERVLAQAETASDRRKDPLLLPRVLHHLPGFERGDSSEKPGRNSGRPQGSGLSLRRNFLEGSGINSSFAVFQTTPGKPRKRPWPWESPWGPATSFPQPSKMSLQHLVARGSAHGAIAGIMEAQYNELRSTGTAQRGLQRNRGRVHPEPDQTPPKRNGLAVRQLQHHRQRGALDWKGKFRDAVAPLFSQLYKGSPTERKQDRAGEEHPADYRQKLDAELAQMRNSECGRPAKKSANCGGELEERSVRTVPGLKSQSQVKNHKPEACDLNL